MNSGNPEVARAGDAAHREALGVRLRDARGHVVVNNSYLGLIRQSQRGFNMDYSVQL